ncbi:50S ribosomal protein L29 [Nodosilinea sp. LEGE 06152]|uniref:50S ribosomal protein L29 n=1 Tax=Nodosilinea sp. LEGE 06152 TaxID=2777966 RepID=UPI00187FEE00|nr:50S ribosomal protein L29 [Nodosilinea sp. LEGE 06152]MBE9158799.1 50S ribosomal protein L29 [Nodosilinea sp. LEGE 06152]
MALSKIKEARSLSDEELLTAIAEIKRELFQLRFQKATRQLDKQNHQFKHARHRLSQLMTVQRERQLAALDEEVAAQANAASTATTESVSV